LHGPLRLERASLRLYQLMGADSFFLPDRRRAGLKLS
jgi:hypothetical protein